MSSYFCLSITLLDSAFHGCGDGGEPEWPPSPLRAFQALVAAAAARAPDSRFASDAAPAFEWLESLEPPEILTPIGRPASHPYRMFVPNNAGDLVVKSWASGSSNADFASLRAEKDVHPVRLVDADAFSGGNTIRFLWRVSNDLGEFGRRLSLAAGGITHLGWGIDMAIGHARLISDQERRALLGNPGLEHWIPGSGVAPLRVPRPKSDQGPGTFEALVIRHQAFVRRMSGGRPNDVPPLTEFKVVAYRRATDAPARAFAAFQLMTPDAERMWNRDARRTIEVAGMLRHTAKLVALAADRPREWIDAFVLGHGGGRDQQAVGAEGANRFTFLPLPTIRPQGVVGAVNRVMVVGPPDGGATEIHWARRMLAGRELIEEQSQSSVAILSPIPASDWVVRQYTGDREGASAWSTVTPVVLPGYDDPDRLRQKLKSTTNSEAKRRILERLEARIDGLLRKTIVQAGFPTALAEHAHFSWRLVGFRAGLDLATHYDWPNHLKSKPRYHVKIHWRDATGSPVKIQGPLVLGAGRYCGLGLFARDSWTLDRD